MVRWRSRNSTLALGAIVLLGLVLRILNARGGLWLDEAWSARLAHDAGTPLGIVLNINYDNNHHLNTLWLQTVGMGAPPIVARLPAIVTGTIAIGVAAAIGARRSVAAGPIAALVFAVSPVLVTLGSEARGYAPMALALLTAVLLTDRWLAGELERNPASALAICFLLGALSHLTILFGFCALAGWVVLERWQRGGLANALRFALRLLGPAAIALAAVFALVLGAAAASPTGFQFGRYDPFGWLRFLRGLTDIIGVTLGLTVAPTVLLVLPPLAVIAARELGVSRLWFYRLAILAFPAALALLQVGNTGYPRYYLVSAIALLLLLADLAGQLWTAGGRWRWAGFALPAILLATGLSEDVRLIANQRGDPAAAIRTMARLAPTGATVSLDRASSAAILEVAAAQAHYRLVLIDRPCDPARFVFIERVNGETFPRHAERCGMQYRPIAQALARGLSGSHWTLYERQR